MYEVKRPLTVRETTSLKPTVEPMLMRPRRQAITVVTAMAITGIDVRSSTFVGHVSKIGSKTHAQAYIPSKALVRRVGLTLDKYLQPGRPRSRAKDHVILEAPATQEMVPRIARVAIIADIVRAPDKESTACRKMAMKGYPVGVDRTVSGSPRQNSKAKSIPKPMIPLIAILKIMARGTTTAAFFISSAI